MLVATDLDGTLLRPDGSLSEYSVQTLTRITAGGTPLVLVTGRPLRWLSTVYGELRLPVPAVCANGAVVYDPASDTVLRTNPFDARLLGQVCERLREAIPDVAFAVEISDGREMRHESAYPLRWDTDDPAVRIATDLYALPAVKLLVRAGDRDADEFTALVSSYVDGLAEATHSSGSGLVELTALGVTKAAGLTWLCERLGVPAQDVVAFGDMPNDVPMLAWAGRAVAVANAHPAVKAVADEVTGSNDEDGVARWLDAAVPAGAPARP